MGLFSCGQSNIRTKSTINYLKNDNTTIVGYDSNYGHKPRGTSKPIFPHQRVICPHSRLSAKYRIVTHNFTNDDLTDGNSPSYQ